MPDVDTRLSVELEHLGVDKKDIRIIKKKDAQFLSWIGGMKLSKSPAIEKLLISSKLYQEHGPKILDERHF